MAAPKNTNDFRSLFYLMVNRCIIVVRRQGRGERTVFGLKPPAVTGKMIDCAFRSSDGRGRCGVYCAANACIEQVIQHGEVDVFQAVKTVRRHRPQLIENMVSYIFPSVNVLRPLSTKCVRLSEPRTESHSRG